MSPTGGRVGAEAGTDAGPRVRAARAAAGLTQAAMAEELGVSRQTVISLERDDYAPSVYLALKVARAVGSSVEELWG